MGGTSVFGSYRMIGRSSGYARVEGMVHGLRKLARGRGLTAPLIFASAGRAQTTEEREGAATQPAAAGTGQVAHGLGATGQGASLERAGIVFAGHGNTKISWHARHVSCSVLGIPMAHNPSWHAHMLTYAGEQSERGLSEPQIVRLVNNLAGSGEC